MTGGDVLVCKIGVCYLFLVISAISAATILVALGAKDKTWAVPLDATGLLASALSFNGRIR